MFVIKRVSDGYYLADILTEGGVIREVLWAELERKGLHFDTEEEAQELASKLNTGSRQVVVESVLSLRTA